MSYNRVVRVTFPSPAKYTSMNDQRSKIKIRHHHFRTH